MFSPVLSIPARRVSAWVAETDPKHASAWLAALPLADSAESAREIYQALYTVNRLELRLQNRLELMAMYDGAVARVCAGLQPHLMHEVPPLGAKKRQLAEFLRRLHVEMAYGYKCCLRDLSRARLSLRRRARSAQYIERALYHLSEVLLRSYAVYLPYPPGVWRETHELYRLAELLDMADEPLEAGAADVAPAATIAQCYVRTVMFGLTNPYQLPHAAAAQVHAFLARWSARARIVSQVGPSEVGGCFLIDFNADSPPVPLVKNSRRGDDGARVVDARALLHTVQDFAVRLERGESIERLGLGFDSLDSTCVDLLHRLIRAWGESARRRYARRQQSSNVFVCVGLNAAHFYASGQRPFASYVRSIARGRQAPDGAAAADVAFVELDDDAVRPPVAPEPDGAATADMHRVNRWQLRDIGPQGMSLIRYGEAIGPIRVGDLIGVRQPSDLGRWRVAVVRWLKTPELGNVELGVELPASSAAPAAVRRPDDGGPTTESLRALSLPATEVTKRPATLLLPRGRCNVGDVVELADEESEPRSVLLLRLLERTGSFEQFVYTEVGASSPPGD